MKKEYKSRWSWTLPIFVCLSGMACYQLYQQGREKQIYDSLKLFWDNTATIEYGTVYDPDKMIKKATGNVTVLSSTVDSHKVGTGNLILEVEKENVRKQFRVSTYVQDTQLPTITLKEKEITLYVGDSYSLNDNIVSVTDPVDGGLTYVSSISEEEMKGQYTIVGDVNYHKVGTYSVVVKAVDFNGNKVEDSFQVHIKSRPIIYTNPNPSVEAGSLKEIAYSLLGSPYVSGGNNPSGFDCSGFVFYVYQQLGKQIPRSSGGQATVGSNISRENMTVGDILIWSSNGSTVTHTGLYVGDGNMIHAANPRKGVILSSVNEWPETLIAIRRI